MLVRTIFSNNWNDVNRFGFFFVLHFCFDLPVLLLQLLFLLYFSIRLCVCQLATYLIDVLMMVVTPTLVADVLKCERQTMATMNEEKHKMRIVIET